MALTLSQTITMAKNQMGEALGTPGGADPIEYVALAQLAADEVAQDTDCYAATQTFDTVANQGSYGAPQGLSKIREVMYTGGDLQMYPLTETTYDEMNDRYTGWQNSPPGTPYWFITEGLNNIILFPTPDASSLIFPYTDLIVGSQSQYQVLSAGQRIFVSTDVGCTILISGGAGFTPGRYLIVSVSAGTATVDQPIGVIASSGGTGEITTGGILLRGPGIPSYTWTSLAQLNPMALPAHMATMWRTCILRCVQFPTRENMLRLPRLEAEYEKAKGRVAKATTQWTQATRRGGRQRTPFGGGYY